MTKKAMLAAFMLMLITSPAIAAGGDRSEDSSKLVMATQAAAKEARRCGVDVDQVDVNTTIKGAIYRVDFVARGKRGGGATVAIDRPSMKVKEVACLQ